MRAFPSRLRAFPGSSRAPILPKRRKRSPADEIPEEERTHVPANRFKLACGAPRIGVDRELLVYALPTCHACKRALTKQKRDAEVMRAASEGILGIEMSW